MLDLTAPANSPRAFSPARLRQFSDLNAAPVDVNEVRKMLKETRRIDYLIRLAVRAEQDAPVTAQYQPVSTAPLTLKNAILAPTDPSLEAEAGPFKSYELPGPSSSKSVESGKKSPRFGMMPNGDAPPPDAPAPQEPPALPNGNPIPSPAGQAAPNPFANAAQQPFAPNAGPHPQPLANFNPADHVNHPLMAPQGAPNAFAAWAGQPFAPGVGPNPQALAGEAMPEHDPANPMGQTHPATLPPNGVAGSESPAASNALLPNGGPTSPPGSAPRFGGNGYRKLQPASARAVLQSGLEAAENTRVAQKPEDLIRCLGEKLVIANNPHVGAADSFKALQARNAETGKLENALFDLTEAGRADALAEATRLYHSDAFQRKLARLDENHCRNLAVKQAGVVTQPEQLLIRLGNCTVVSQNIRPTTTDTHHNAMDLYQKPNAQGRSQPAIFPDTEAGEADALALARTIMDSKAFKAAWNRAVQQEKAEIRP